MDTFLQVLTMAWIVLGFLLISFNVQISLLFCPQVLGICGDTWQLWRMRAYVIQVVWNLLVFGLGFANTLVQQITDNVTFTLSHEKYYPNDTSGYWNYAFYRNGKPIDDWDADATPFQKAMNPSNRLYPEFELDAEGLNESNPEYFTVAFDRLSEQKARAYIESFNRERGELANPMAIPTCLVMWIGVSLLAPFWLLVFEALGIMAILFPGLFLICFGPTLWTVMRSLGFIGWITSLFHDI
jgi:hypothetical protein